MFTETETATEKDFDEIVEVWEASVRATHHFLTESDIVFFKPLVRNEFLKTVNLYCVRNNEQEILGFLGVAEGKIEMLFLHPTAFGKGLGRKLLLFAIQKLGAKKLDVNEDNPQAVGFYHHMGFITVSRSPRDSLGKPFPILHLELPELMNRHYNLTGTSSV